MSANYRKLRGDLSPFDKLIDSIAGMSEGEINKSLVSRLSLYKADLGTVGFKGRFFSATIETQTAKSHGKICTMQLPSKKRTELGDIIVAVDYVLDDLVEHKKKIINGAASMIQTKKEEYTAEGLSAAQMYLMTQLPRFRYKKSTWKFKVFSDAFAFYLFILDPKSSQREKSSMMSASMLMKYLDIDKASLLSNIDGKVKFSHPDLMRRERIGRSTMPLSFGSFLLRGLNLTLGSPSVELRRFLKQNFFSSMEEVEDCSFTKALQQKLNGMDWPKEELPSNEMDGDILAIRLKVILRRVD